MSKYYFLGKQRLAMRQNGKLTYLHGDHLGSASLATDAAGVTMSQQRYLPYGGLRWMQSGSVFPTDWQYTDQQRQTTHLTGIRMVEYYDYRARMYDPKVGRFISPDSIVPDEKNPQSLNRYMYTLGNPVKFTDPSGHQACNTSGDDRCYEDSLELKRQAQIIQGRFRDGSVSAVDALALLSDEAMRLFEGDTHGYMWGMTAVLMGADINTDLGNQFYTQSRPLGDSFIGMEWLGSSDPNRQQSDWATQYYDGTSNQAYHFWAYAALTYTYGAGVGSAAVIAHDPYGGIDGAHLDVEIDPDNPYLDNNHDGVSYADIHLGYQGVSLGQQMTARRYYESWGYRNSFDPSAWIRQNLRR